MNEPDEILTTDEVCALLKIKKGTLYGLTADERPCTTLVNPVPVQDLHATLYHALGIPPNTSYLVEKRPVYVTHDGVGKPIRDLFERG